MIPSFFHVARSLDEYMEKPWKLLFTSSLKPGGIQEEFAVQVEGIPYLDECRRRGR